MKGWKKRGKEAERGNGRQKESRRESLQKMPPLKYWKGFVPLLAYCFIQLHTIIHDKL